MKTYKGLIKYIPENGIFVFGSNTQGRHGAGTAKIALDIYGAKYGQSLGLQGISYAICTKDLTKSIHPSVSKENIEFQILILYNYAEKNKDLDFFIAYTANGINLNAYTPQEMADMFSSSPIPENIVFEEEFAKLLKNV